MSEEYPQDVTNDSTIDISMTKSDCAILGDRTRQLPCPGKIWTGCYNILKANFAAAVHLLMCAQKNNLLCPWCMCVVTSTRVAFVKIPPLEAFFKRPLSVALSTVV